MEKQIKEQIQETIAEAVTNGTINEIVIREGKALELREPEAVRIVGTIDSPARWAEAKSGIDINRSHVSVNRDWMTIELKIDETSPYGTDIEGRLEWSMEFKKIGINTNNYMTAQQLAELIKMNRAYFENRTQAMKLTSDLMSFKAKVNKYVESSDNNRGNKSLILNQAVEHNLPEAFTLSIPLFKGQPKTNIECEVYVRAEDLCCTLVSAQANEVIEDTKNEIMDVVIDRITTALPGIAVLEI
ncbi:MAG: hypothetical protein MJZ26_08940 [Fibrobacter sp.]|nr:hypothetical protein [Fibrobacter sp.]